MAKGYSLHIGLNRLSPAHYGGWEGRLGSCVNDAHAMASLAERQQFSMITSLINEQATIDKIIEKIAALSRTALANDLVLITFSGHGGQVLDLDRDEPDRKDESWLLYDGQLVDDKIFELLQGFEEAVRVLIVSDSCHSGSVFRPNERPRFPPTHLELKREDAAKIKASVRLLAACRDHEYAQAGSELSQYTEALLRIWDEGRFEGDYAALNAAIRKTQPLKRNPVHRTMGKWSEWLEGGRVFVV